MVNAQALGIDDGFRALRTGINSGSHQLVLFGDGSNFADALSALSGSNCGCLIRPSRWSFRTFALTGIRHRQEIGIRLLHAGNALSRLHRALETFVVKTVRGGAGSLAIKCHAD